VHRREIDEITFGQTFDAVPHAVDAINNASSMEAQAQAFDDADEGLIDDGGGTTGLTDDCIAADEIFVEHDARARNEF
jgi:hypothetical protein